MEQRLGKTLTIIRHLKAHIELTKNPVLIVCPNAIKGTWAFELESEKEKSFAIMEGSKKNKLNILKNDFRFIICNYESVKPLDLHLYEWGAVVLDESIYIANPKSARTKYFLNSFLHIQRKYVMCGLPAPESELQYFCQQQFVFGKFMGHTSFWSYRVEYYIQMQYTWTAKRGHKRKIYEELRKNCFILSRVDAGIGSKKLYQTIKVTPTTSQKKSYNEMYREFEADGIFTKYAPVKYLYMHKISGGVNLNMKEWHSTKKFEAIIEMLNEELHQQQVVVWFKYLHEIEMFANILKTNVTFKDKFLKITGDTPSSGREMLRKSFHRGEYTLALMTIKSNRAGSDWSCADTSIYFSNEFSNDLRSQSEDRIIHPKIKTPKLIIDLATDNSIDLDIIELLKGKKLSSQFFMSSLYEKMLLRGTL